MCPFSLGQMIGLQSLGGSSWSVPAGGLRTSLQPRSFSDGEPGLASEVGVVG